MNLGAVVTKRNTHLLHYFTYLCQSHHAKVIPNCSPSISVIIFEGLLCLLLFHNIWYIQVHCLFTLLSAAYDKKHIFISAFTPLVLIWHVSLSPLTSRSSPSQCKLESTLTARKYPKANAPGQRSQITEGTLTESSEGRTSQANSATGDSVPHPLVTHLLQKTFGTPE